MRRAVLVTDSVGRRNSARSHGHAERVKGLDGTGRRRQSAHESAPSKRKAPESSRRLARHLGIRTINVVRRRDAVEEIKTLGGDQVICTEDEDLLQRVAEIAGPAGVRKAIDCVSGDVGAQVSQALAPGGEVVVYGALSTHRQADPAALTIPLLARSIIYQTKAVRGFWLYRWFSAASPQDALRALQVRQRRRDGHIGQLGHQPGEHRRVAHGDVR
ncbi:zinc-binding dehydrogenase [Nocardia sp. CA-119907]|uniref:zinc-binding dehydrogenase n=1 Tax=Nocardia sp. CA-119907 TaxID=3239973 RepID=UPI003D95C9E2